MTVSDSGRAAHAPGPRGGAAPSAFRYVVGYGGDKRSKDAVRLGVALARAFDAQLELVCVLRADDPFQGVYPPVGDISSVLRQQASGWLAEAQDLIPDDVVVRSHIRTSPSVAIGLLDAVHEFGASLLVVGAASGKYAARFRLGPVANTLLHSAPVPVALAPRGYQGDEPITRLYAGIGSRSGGRRILEESEQVLARTGLELVLVNFLPLDGVHGEPEEALTRANTMLTEAAREIGEHHSVGVHVATGKNLKKTVAELDWKPGGVLFVGSSRLAGEQQLFLGTTAARILNHLPIPMLVLPTTADDDSGSPAYSARGEGQGRPDTGPGRSGGARGVGGAGPNDQEATP